MQDQCGLDSESIGRKALADLLTSYGYCTKASEVRGAFRSKLVFGVVPVTEKSLKLLRILLKHFPSFEYESLFEVGKAATIHRRL